MVEHKQASTVGNAEGLCASASREIENVVVSGNSHSPKIGRLPFPASITVTGTVYIKIYKISPDLVGIIKCTLETRSGTVPAVSSAMILKAAVADDKSMMGARE